MSSLHIGWPQGILLAIVCLEMGICMARFGEPKRDRYDLVDLLLGPAIMLSILYWGGFFG